MPFVNKANTIISDDFGNLFCFLWNDGKLSVVCFEKELGKTETVVLVEDCSLEYDVAINDENEMYLACQKNDGSLLLLSYLDQHWSTSVLSEKGKVQINNLNVMAQNEKVHIIYCTPSYEDHRTCRIYHHFYDQHQWNTHEIGDIRRGDILNPFQLILYQDRLLLGYYHLMNTTEQIFINEYDFVEGQWKPPVQLTYGEGYKLYLDMLKLENDDFHITYSQYIEGNLVIKYEKFKIESEQYIKITDEIISNPANCSYPTFVWQGDKLWIAWSEYDQLVSCYTLDKGVTWSIPYLWKESKEQNFTRYKYRKNESVGKMKSILNYSFGWDYPKLTFIGFGALDQAIEIPLLAKKKDQEGGGVKMNQSEIKRGVEKDERVNTSLQENGSIEDKLRRLEERIEEIEEYLNRRRRGLLFPQRK